MRMNDIRHGRYGLVESTQNIGFQQEYIYFILTMCAST